MALQNFQPIDWCTYFSVIAALLRNLELFVFVSIGQFIDYVCERAWFVAQDRGEIFEAGRSFKVSSIDNGAALIGVGGLQALLCVRVWSINRPIAH
jgi:hypothetical protein